MITFYYGVIVFILIKKETRIILASIKANSRMTYL